MRRSLGNSGDSQKREGIGRKIKIKIPKFGAKAAMGDTKRWGINNICPDYSYLLAITGRHLKSKAGKEAASVGV